MLHRRSDAAWFARRWVRGPVIALLLAALGGQGCDSTSTGGGGGLFGGSGRGKETWAIRCRELRGEGHRRQADGLARMLGQVAGLDPKKVRVVSDGAGSAVYYGAYRKIESPDGRLVFPEQLGRDMDLIQRMTSTQGRPFAYATPELIGQGTSGDDPEPWLITRAKGTYTLQVAVFYDTPTFNQRKEAAAQYVKVLRDEGFVAYYWHGPRKSLVAVGDFGESDIIEAGGGKRIGPRVQQLIDRNPDEFKHVTENGFLRKMVQPDGTLAPTSSYLIKVPRPGGSSPPGSPGR